MTCDLRRDAERHSFPFPLPLLSPQGLQFFEDFVSRSTKIECKHLCKGLDAEQRLTYDSSVEMYSSDYLAKSLGLGDNIGNYFIYKNSGGGTRPDLPHLKKNP